jgi:thymidine kinase
MINNNDGYLHLILGPMFAGKSTKLFNIIENLKEKNESFLLIKHIIDKRYNSNTTNIITHDQKSMECVGLDQLLNIIDNEKYTNSKYIFIDEGQFFPDINKFIDIALEKDYKNIYITGLNGDSNRKPFYNISKLISIADKVDVLDSKCCYCNNKGIFTLRKSSKHKKILVGDDKIYKPVCRNHYIEHNNTQSTV